MGGKAVNERGFYSSVTVQPLIGNDPYERDHCCLKTAPVKKRSSYISTLLSTLTKGAPRSRLLSLGGFVCMCLSLGVLCTSRTESHVPGVGIAADAGECYSSCVPLGHTLLSQS